MIVCALVLALSIVPEVLGAVTVEDLRWRLRQVNYPVSSDDVRPRVPHVTKGTSIVTGPITIGPDRGMALLLEPLELVRVRRIDVAHRQPVTPALPEGQQGGASGTGNSAMYYGPTIPIHAVRIIGSASGAPAHTDGVIEEPTTTEVGGEWLLSQPPGRSDIWYVSAPVAMTVVVEEPLFVADSRQWEQVRGDMVRWIARDIVEEAGSGDDIAGQHDIVPAAPSVYRDTPALPRVAASSALAFALAVDRELEQLMARAFPADSFIHDAMQAWRVASALRRIDAESEPSWPYFSRRDWTAKIAAGAKMVALSRQGDAGMEPASGRRYGLLRIGGAAIQAMRSGSTPADASADGVTPVGQKDGQTDGQTEALVPEAREELAAAEWSHTAELSGPGMLEVEMRASWSSDAPGTVRKIQIISGRTELARAQALARHVYLHRPQISQAVAARGQPLMTTEGALAGPLVRMRVPLESGLHRYRIAISGGDVLVRARVIRRRGQLLAVLRQRATAEHWIARARRARRGVTGPAGDVIDALLRNLDSTNAAEFPPSLPPPLSPSSSGGRGAPVNALPPLVRAAHEIVTIRGLLRGAQQGPTSQRSEAEALYSRIRIALEEAIFGRGQPEIGSQLAWALVLEMAIIATDAGAIDVLRSLTSTRGRPPAIVLARLAALRYTGDPNRESRNLARSAAQRAWRQSPTDPAIKRIFSALWRSRDGGRWRRLDQRPSRTGRQGVVSIGSGGFGFASQASDASNRSDDVGSLLGPNDEQDLDKGEDNPGWPVARYIDVRRRDGNTAANPDIRGGGRWLWSLPLGRARKVHLPPYRAQVERPVLMRVYVAMPSSVSGPVTVAVDGERFPMRMAHEVEVITLAIAAGQHDIAVFAPSGSKAFISWPPAEASAPVRLRHMWPTAAAGRSRRFLIPSAQRGMPVRLTLRASRLHLPGDERASATSEASEAPRGSLDAVQPAAVRVHVRADTGYSRTVSFLADRADPTLLPLGDTAALSPAVRTTMWLPADVGALWFDVDPGVALWARVEVRDSGSPPIREVARGLDGVTSGQMQQETELHRPASDTDIPAEGSAEWEHALTEIAQLSQMLIAQPERIELWLRRGHRLLDIGERVYGRSDLDRFDIAYEMFSYANPYANTNGELDGKSERALQLRVQRQILKQRLDNWSPGAYLPLQPQALTMPAAVEPGFLPLLRPIPPVSPQSATSALVRYWRASDFGRRQEWWSAAQILLSLYEEIPALAIALETAAVLESAIRASAPDSHSASDSRATRAVIAATAYGFVTTALARWEHPAFRRLLRLAAVHSQWELIRGTESNAGYEQVYSDSERLELAASDRLQRALMAVPWRASDSSVISPGRGTILSLNVSTPTNVRIEAWCQILRVRPHATPESVTDADCRLAWRQNNQARDQVRLAMGRVHTLDTRSLTPGKHQLEVQLQPDSSYPGAAQGSDPVAGEVTGDAAGNGLVRRAVVRFIAVREQSETPSEEAISITKPGRLYAADQERPVTAVVLGPTAVRIEARRYGDHAPVKVDIEASSDSGRRTHSLVVDTPTDDATNGNRISSISLSQAVIAVMHLPEAGVHHVRVHARDGQALIRLWRRADRGQPLMAESQPDGDGGDVASAETAPIVDSALARLLLEAPWPPPVALVRERHWHLRAGVERWLDVPSSVANNLWLTLSAGVSVQRDDLVERDVDDAPLQHRVSAYLAWRRQALPGRLWFRVQPSLRWHPGTEPALGFQAAMAARQLPGRSRLDIDIRLFTQATEDGGLWAARGRLRLGRLFLPRPSVGVEPGFSAWADLASYEGTPFGDAIDPLIYNDYSRDHGAAVRPYVNVFWRPLVDLRWNASAYAVTNADLSSVDHAGIALELQGVMPWPYAGIPRYRLRYRPGYRFADADRDISYMRHDLSIGIDLNLWTNLFGRLVLEFSDRIYIGSPLGSRNIIFAGLRYDIVAGRGLRDMLPSERRFDRLIEFRSWGD